MKNKYYKNILILNIIFLFLLASVIPSISGYTRDTGQSNNKIHTNYLLNDDYVNVYWEFDDCGGTTLTDSAHNYDGIINGATWTSNGHSGCALIFDGANDYVDLNSHTEEIAINKTDDVIYSFYFKSTSGGIIYSTTSSQGYNPAMVIELIPNNGTLLFKIWTLVCGIALYSEGSYNDGKWYHAEYYFNGITANPTVTLNVDGDFDSKTTHWLCEIANDDFSKTRLGMHAVYSSDYFDGYLDDFKIIKFEGGNKQVPPTIDGPTYGDPNVEYDYSFITNDPEGDDILLYVNWDDGYPDEWIGPYASGEEVVLSHKWPVDGLYNITARSQDSWGKSHSSSPYQVRIGNHPPNPPTIKGPRYGEDYDELTYKFVATDFENHDLYYYIDWDDGNPDEWIGPYASGEEISVNHIWYFEGDYSIKAKVRDIKNLKSEWSEEYIIRLGDEPPSIPDINGPRVGTPGVEYDYTFNSFDPEGDNISYEIKWGDGDEIITTYYTSGSDLLLSHKWDGEGKYIISARANDTFGYLSDWKEITITMPRDKSVSNPYLIRFLERFQNIFPILQLLLERIGL
ncbi:hypothetical protein AYK20_04085 [Thermoplasmatales archaeon SG8-52-1]|nr:MAG: hypothetical protein AYK20_04085 [Thermoplasmatales archaeon SG8-52-1]